MSYYRSTPERKSARSQQYSQSAQPTQAYQPRPVVAVIDTLTIIYREESALAMRDVIIEFDSNSKYWTYELRDQNVYDIHEDVVAVVNQPYGPLQKLVNHIALDIKARIEEGLM